MHIYTYIYIYIVPDGVHGRAAGVLLVRDLLVEVRVGGGPGVHLDVGMFFDG